jgi:flagellar basal body rod protein FlgG
VFRQSLVDAVDRSNGTLSQRYAVTRTVEPNFKQGQIVNTGNKLDVAITDDKSFFAVQTPGGVRYTRAGAIRVAPDGMLTTPDGFPYLGHNKRPVLVPPDTKSATFAPDGSVLVDTGLGSGMDTLGQLERVTFRDVSALEKEGNVMFRASEASGQPIRTEATLAVESLELSNASPVKAMSGLVSSSRQFEMVSKVIEAFSALERRAATDLMKKR